MDYTQLPAETDLEMDLVSAVVACSCWGDRDPSLGSGVVPSGPGSGVLSEDILRAT